MFSHVRAMFKGAYSGYIESFATVLDDDPGWGSVNTYDTAAGVKIDHRLALSMAAVYACVTFLSKSLAQLPLFLIRNDGTGTDKKMRALEHPLYDILHSKSNPVQTSYQFRQMMMAHLSLRGNAFAEIQRNRGGQIIALWPWHPNLVRVEVEGRKVLYFFTSENGVEVRIPTKNVLHLRGLSLDGVMGISPISAARETFGESYAAQQFGAGFFKNGAAPPYVLTSPNVLTETVLKNLRKSFENLYTGIDKAQKIAILGSGLEPKSIGLNLVDAQFIETRKFTRTEIAGIFGVPAHFIGDLEQATFSNIENLAQQFVQHTLQPLLVNWEQQMNATLLTQEERLIYNVEHNVDGLLRGDRMARTDWYTKAISSGVLSPNEVRALEGRNPREGGDEYLTPLNMRSTDDPVDMPDVVDSDEDTKV